MGPKPKPDGAASKMSGKNVEEQETPFDPVPYETLDVRTSITLLSSAEKSIVVRALNTLAKYADKKDLNVVFLYKNGIVGKLLELIVYSDITILRFTLKLLGQVMRIPDASKELTLDQYFADIKQINYLYMTIDDLVVKEFSSQFLSQVVKTSQMASTMLKMGTLVTIFKVLKTNTDPDTQLNTLIYFNNILAAKEASAVIPNIVEFSAKTILCYLKNKISEIRDAALKVIETLISWKCGPIQELLKNDQVVEALFKVIFKDDYKALHKRCFNIILTCTECVETASYFIKSLEFVQFCEWVKTCPKKFILPSATILTSLTKQLQLRQVLFDFSVEDAILLFFRTENEQVFYKTCEGIINMSSHKFCCKKIMTPTVIECVINMLNRNKIPIIPYHEIALKTLCLFMKRDGRALDYIVACNGLKPIMESFLKDKERFTDEGLDILMEIVYLFSASIKYKESIMNSEIYEVLLNRFDSASEYSQKALVILSSYIDNSDYRQYFLGYGGPEKVINKITSTPEKQELINVLMFLQQSFIYKKIGMAFLWKGLTQLLQNMSAEMKEAIPLINHLLNTMYGLYIPLKFHTLGRLDITDQFSSRFYLITGPHQEDFFFLEIIEKTQVSPASPVYIVDFSADSDKLLKKTLLLPVTDSTSSDARLVRSSTLKDSPSTKSGLAEEENEPLYSILTCRVDPPINYGFISEDPYLPKYVEKLKTLLYNNKKYILCFQHQVKVVAKFVHDLLSGPKEAGTDLINDHCFEIHLKTLRLKLGTNLIPIGFLRYGSYCERALLFKALAEKVGIPTTLVKGNVVGKNNLIYWNEVPIVSEEPYVNVNDGQKTYLSYAVVDLMQNVGNLMLTGSFEANKYCGLET